jgi:hypothetical protein
VQILLSEEDACVAQASAHAFTPTALADLVLFPGRAHVWAVPRIPASQDDPTLGCARFFFMHSFFMPCGGWAWA